MKRSLPLLLAALLGLTLLVPLPASAAAEPYCGIWWGSLPKQSSPAPLGTTHLTNVRTGRHACFDRLVVDLDGPLRGYRVEYVDEVYTDGAGDLVPLRGGARLRVIVEALSHDVDYAPTYDPADPDELRSTSGYRTFHQVASGGTFEGQTVLGLGVRGRLPFRVFTLDGPGPGSRLVVDVAHRW